MLYDVLEFNRSRNKFVLDMKNEEKMLVEEVQEFFDATTLAERIDAVIDVQFVYEGTEMKCMYNAVAVPPEVSKWIGQFHRTAMTIINDELGDNAQYVQKIMEGAYKIVCDANAMKTKELDADGKVVKGNIPNATEQIAELLKSVIG